MLPGRAKPDIDRSLAVSFTGHRAETLPWGFDESDPRCIELKRGLRRSILELYRGGKRIFLSGMASGVDAIAAEEVLSLKTELADIRLVCVFPCPTRDARSQRIAALADGCVTMAPEYCAGCMQLRNRFLVENASCLIACYDGRKYGGTYQTVSAAEARGLPIRFIKP